MSEQPNEQQQQNPGAALAEMIQANPEVLMDALSMAADTAQAIQDIAPQIELLSRVNLARSFIQLQAGKVSFDAAAFERAWTYLTGDNQEQTGGKEQTSPQK